MKKLLLTLLTLFLFACASHDKQNKHYYSKIAPSKLKKDVTNVQKQLVKMHPDLYWYISKEDLNKKFDSLSKSLIKPLTPNEFFFKISPIVAAVHQGHMGVSMVTLTSPDSLKKKYKGSVNPLENFEYEYLNNKLFIKKNKSKTDTILQVGTEIVDINGIKPLDVLKKYRSTFTSDGYNESGIPKFFARRLNSFYVNELGFVDSIKINAVCADTTFYHTVKRTFKESKKSKKDLALKEKHTLKNTKIVQKDTLPKLSKKEQKIKNKAIAQQNKKAYKKQRLFGYNYKSKTYSKEIIFPVASDSTISILKIRDFTDGKYKSVRQYFLYH